MNAMVTGMIGLGSTLTLISAELCSRKTVVDLPFFSFYDPNVIASNMQFIYIFIPLVTFIFGKKKKKLAFEIINI